jgi:uncharacterized membrane protein
VGILGGLGSVASWWAVYYSDHQMVSLVVRYAHLGALMVGGGTALAIDRLVLGLARRQGHDRRRAALTALHGSHIVVVPALMVVTLSGVLMAIADWSTFAGSRIFIAKMIFVGLLIANGAALMAAERAYTKGDDANVWRRVAVASGASFLLWLLILWLGEWLTVAA